MENLETLLQLNPNEKASWGPLKKPITIDFYKEWLKKNYHGDMEFLAQHLPTKEQPHKHPHHPSFNSLISLTIPYLPHPNSKKVFPHLKVALYAQGEDYHHWLKDRLNQIIKNLTSLYPDSHFLPFTDSGPLLERDHAHQLGLGWIGKNTCLLNRDQGSLFFIAQILTTLQLETRLTETSPNFCGTCNRCIEACPTNALEEPYLLNANKCISYLTIEYKKTIPLELRPQMQDWLFGCDICQTVCPWNQKIYSQQLTEKPHSSIQIEQELKEILTTSNKQLMKTYQGTPLTRAGGRSLKRNALIIIGNKKIHSLRPQVLLFLNHPRLNETAQWSLTQLDS